MRMNRRHCIYFTWLLWSNSASAFLAWNRHSTRSAVSLQQQQQQQHDQKLNITVCLVDHYDSYTYNLYDMIAASCITPPVVVAKDVSVENLPQHVDGYVLSPGPGRPPTDTGISLCIIQNNPTIPIFGVCLGHQALGFVYGANITEAPTPVHGQVHAIQHVVGENVMWNNIHSPLNVVRYHSLIVQDWNECDVPLKATAWYTNDDDTKIIMGLSHKDNPHYGLQFHPESIGTQQGMTLVKNFLQVCQEYKHKKSVVPANDVNDAAAFLSNVTNGAATKVEKYNNNNRVVSICEEQSIKTEQNNVQKRLLHQHIRRVDDASIAACPVNVFSALYANHSFAAWLDSSNAHHHFKNMSRFSIMAAMDGPLSRRMEYFVHTQMVHEYNNASGRRVEHSMDILSFLKQDLESMELLQNTTTELPFEYCGGYLGFLGYEVRHDTQRALQQLEHGQVQSLRQSQSEETPSAAFLFADQSLVYDHWTHQWYLVGLSSDGDDDASVLKWMDRVEKVLLNMESSSTAEEAHLQQQYHHPPLAFVPNRSRERYRKDIATCHEQIRLGESYELCLTNQLETTVSQEHSPLQLYKLLRQRNPVPFAAFVNFQRASTPLSICCSSPERFVSVKKQSPNHHDDTLQQTSSLHVEAKPIKGTCARQVVTDRPRTLIELQEDARRARELETCVKNRAENLMIVDLLRNDLNRVCQVGSVHVPKLMQIESYTTVHQMVSTIRGILSQEKNAIDVLQACFPGGSMTGAPKLRSMEILDELEDSVPRGPYSGCLGYISLNGSMDMNIVIRSAVLTPENEKEWHVRIGAGGAITALSESEDEYEEMLLKARAVVEAVQAWANTPAEGEASSVPRTNMTLANTM